MERDFFNDNQVVTIQKVEDSSRIEGKNKVLDILLNEFPNLELYIAGKDNYYTTLFFNRLIIAEKFSICWCSESETDTDTQLYIASKDAQIKHYCNIRIASK